MGKQCKEARPGKENVNGESRYCEWRYSTEGMKCQSTLEKNGEEIWQREKRDQYLEDKTVEHRKDCGENGE